MVKIKPIISGIFSGMRINKPVFSGKFSGMKMNKPKNKPKNKPIINEIFSSRRIYMMIAVCCGLSILLGVIMTAASFISYRNDEQTFRELAQAAQWRYESAAAENNNTEVISDENETDEENSIASGESQTESEDTYDSASEPAQISRSSPEKLSGINSDCIGWLRIEGTRLDYPVMHTPYDPLKYLNINFYGKKSTAGVPFLDARCDLTNSDNLIFYGHRMKSGSMFSCLKNYTGKKYYEKHPVIELTTADGVHRFRIFAVFTSTKTDSWYCFTKFVNSEEFNTVVSIARSKALYDTGIRPEYGTRLITLSSCHGSGKDGRILVIGMEEK